MSSGRSSTCSFGPDTVPSVIDDVVGGLADFGIISGEVVSGIVERIDLRRESIHVIFPRDHPLADTSAPVRLAQLRDVPLVSSTSR